MNRVFVDASYSPQHQIAVIAWLTPAEDQVSTRIFPCIGCAEAEKYAVQLGVEHLLGLGFKDGIIYSDHQGLLKLNIPAGFHIEWIKGHDKKINKVTEEKILFSKVDRAARKQLRQLVKQN